MCVTTSQVDLRAFNKLMNDVLEDCSEEEFQAVMGQILEHISPLGDIAAAPSPFSPTSSASVGVGSLYVAPRAREV